MNSTDTPCTIALQYQPPKASQMIVPKVVVANPAAMLGVFHSCFDTPILPLSASGILYNSQIENTVADNEEMTANPTAISKSNMPFVTPSHSIENQINAPVIAELKKSDIVDPFVIKYNQTHNSYTNLR